MKIAHFRRVVISGLLLAVTLAVSGCYYGPAPFYPRYAYRPAPYWGGGYGYGYRP